MNASVNAFCLRNLLLLKDLAVHFIKSLTNGSFGQFLLRALNDVPPSLSLISWLCDI